MVMEENRVASRAGLTTDQRREFEETGLLHLPGAIPAEHTCEMRDRLWGELARRHQIRRDDLDTWIPGGVYGLHAVERSGAFANMASPAVCAALDDFFAPDKWQRPPRWGGPLVTFPSERREWDVPNQSWHLDVGSGGVERTLREVIVFAILDTLLPQGGGTAVVAGSHRLVQDLASGSSSKVRSAKARKLLARSDPWLQDLSSREKAKDRLERFMTDGAVVRGVGLKVTEITGALGDVVVMHPAILHSAAANCRTTPRLVLRQSIFRAE